MNSRIPLSLCLAAALASPAWAESLESAHFGASAAFVQLQSFQATKMPARPAAFSQLAGSQVGPFLRPVTLVPGPGSVSRLVKEIELGPLLNRHLKTSLEYSMGGAMVWVSGAFDREQEAFVSILEQGKAPRFFNVKGLLTAPQMLDIGTLKFRLSLSPDLQSPLDSEIKLTNSADRKDQKRIMLGEMLDAVAAAGEPLVVGTQTYSLFYYDDVSGGTKSFCFILKDAGGELHIYLVPAELVPAAGKPAVFKMYQNKPIGMIQVGAKLQISE